MTTTGPSQRDVDFLIERVEDLEIDKRRLTTHRDGIRHLFNRYRWFLKSLLELEPSLERFRLHRPEMEGGTDWDYEGVLAAIEFNRDHAEAIKYLQPNVSAK